MYRNVRKNRILFLCKKRVNSYGISTGLYQSSLFVVNYLKSKGVPVALELCQDANSIDEYVHKFKPTIVMIHAIWVTPLKMAELAYRYPKIRWNIRIHSKLPFLSNEGNAIGWISEYMKIPNVIVSTNNEQATIEMNLAVNNRIICLPNIYDLTPIHHKEKSKDSKWIDIGCFGAIRPLKNILMQAAAAIAFGNKKNRSVRFHINSARTEQGGEGTLKNLRALFANSNGKHELIEHLWKPYGEFVKLVGSMDIGMQTSLSETFNIVTADFVRMGVPIVVSKEIEWMPGMTKADPNEIKKIVRRLNSLYGPLKRWIFQIMSRCCLNRHNAQAKKAWLKYSVS